jgi:glycosyltransferase involved in cell wall biosynthesis
MKLAIVVPARDEQPCLPQCLSSLKPFRDAGDPIVVVDNGSRDATGSIARDRGFETLIESRAGRGHAVATGYRAVRDRAAWILVVHADMVVPEGTREALAAALKASPECVTGALGHRIDDRRLVFRAIEAGNRWRARVLRIPYGDQAQFFSVAAIEASGGFPEEDDGEDFHLALRLRRLGGVVYVDRPVTIPSRHWNGGVVSATLKNWLTVVRLAWAGRRRKPA